MEHRWGQRILVDIPAMVGSGDRRAAARICDASLSGAFLVTRMRLPLFSRVDIRLIPMTPIAATTTIGACIVRNQHDGLGIEWCEFAPAPIRELFTRLPTSLPPGQHQIDRASARHLPAALS